MREVRDIRVMLWEREGSPRRDSLVGEPLAWADRLFYQFVIFFCFP